MTSKLDHYRKLRDEYLAAEEWAQRISKSVLPGLAVAVISHTDSGIRRIEEAPRWLFRDCGHPLLPRMSERLSAAMLDMSQRVREAADAVADEHAKLMHAARLPTPEPK